LEVQRQALVDLEASILEAQKEVRGWLGIRVSNARWHCS
jgi:hypothetical protein